MNEDLPMTDPRGIAEEQRLRLRKRAATAISRAKGRLPKFTAAQRELLINIVVAAYEAGEMETAQYLYSVTLAEAQERSRRGVIARRAKSRRAAIIKAFNAAAAKRQEVSIEQLAKEHGVSRATAYRALAMAASKPKK